MTDHISWTHLKSDNRIIEIYGEKEGKFQLLDTYIEQKEDQMNEEITNPGTEADTAAPAKKLTDAELEAILAGKPAFVAEDDKAEEVTVH